MEAYVELSIYIQRLCKECLLNLHDIPGFLCKHDIPGFLCKHAQLL